MSNRIVQPRINATLTSADVAVENTAQRVLLVGMQTTAGSAATGILSESIANGGVEDDLFGPSSQLAGMIRAFKVINPIVSIDAIGFVDNGAAKAVWTIDFNALGLATEAGTLEVTVGGPNHVFTLPIADADTDTDVVATLVALINLDTRCPMTAAASVNEVVLTADNAGLQANSYGVEVTGTVAGITNGTGSPVEVRLVAGSVEPTNAVLTTAIDLIGDRRYQGIVWGFTSTTVVETLLDARFNIDNKILDGVAFHWSVDDHTDTLTTLSSVNSKSLVVFCDRIEAEFAYKGPAQNEFGPIKCAMFAAIRSLRLTDGTSISQYLTSNESLDQFGGAALASLPYFNTPFPGIPVAPPQRGWTDLEIEELFDAGGSVIGTNSPGDTAISGEVVTTYLTDPGGSPDPTWQFLNSVDVMSGAREYIVSNWRKRFAQTRLTTGSAVRGRGMVNKAIFTAYTESLYLDLTGPNFVLGVGGETAIVFFKQNLTVVIDMVTGRITTTMEFPMVVGMREIIATIKVSFSTEG